MSEKEAAFGAHCAEAVHNNGLFGHAAEWTVCRAQQFVYGLEGRKLRDIDATYLMNYLNVLGRNASLDHLLGRLMGDVPQERTNFLFQG